MTFPAWDAFDGDPRVKTRHVKVYRYCRATLDFREVRFAKRENVAEKTGIHQADVTRALTALVQWGYLIEHPRDTNGLRRFTLAWSRRGGDSPPLATAAEHTTAP
jgi:hypothetical protein